MADLEAEILAPGTYKGVAVTEATLDEIAANFARLHPKGIRPAVKLGHDWSDSEPAVGWVSGVKRVGDKLVAELSDVADIVKKAVKAKRYARCSAEFWKQFEHSPDEKNLKSGVKGAVLTGLALLGSRPPAVKSLRDLEAFLADTPADDAAVLALSDDTPTIVDEAQAVRGDGGSGAGPVASSPPQLDVTALAAALAEHLRSREACTPRKPEPVTDPTKEPRMDDATKQALLSELRTSLSEEFEAKLADERTKHTTELAALETKLAEAKQKGEADLKTAQDELAAIRTREQQAQAEARHIAAVKFAEDQLRAPRLFKGQVPFATALYEMLSDAPVVQAEAAEAMGLPKRDWSLRALFAECVEQYPTANILRELAQAPTQPVNSDPGDALTQIALEHKLNLAEPAGLAQALALAKGKNVVIPDYSTPTARRGH